MISRRPLTLDELIVLNCQEDLNKYRKRIRYYARIQLLFIDDFAINRYSAEGIKILYHPIKLRDDLGTSILFSCQYSPDEWWNQLSDEKECYSKLDGIRRRLTTGFTYWLRKHSFLLEQRSILISRAESPLPYWYPRLSV